MTGRAGSLLLGILAGAGLGGCQVTATDAGAPILAPPSVQAQARTPALQVTERSSRCIELYRQRPSGGVQIQRNGHPLVFKVLLGQRPSTGYGIELAQPRGRLAEGVLEIKLQERAPSKSSAVGMMVTYPCVTIEAGSLSPDEVRRVEIHWQ